MELYALKETVRRLAGDYQARKGSLPNAEQLENELYFMAGAGSEVSASVLLIPVNSPDMKNIGSACGECGNRIFSKMAVAGYLRIAGVREFLGIVYEPDVDETYADGAIPLCSIVLPIRGMKGQAFEWLAEKSGGSFRYEESEVPGCPGWSIYESE